MKSKFNGCKNREHVMFIAKIVFSIAYIVSDIFVGYMISQVLNVSLLSKFCRNEKLI